MFTVQRVALAATAFVCLAGAATISAPSFASETSNGNTATAMLAAVTGPLLAVDVRTLQAQQPDFSTRAGSDGSPAEQADTSSATDQATSLADLVSAHEDASADDDATNCLATSVYYESKGEPLAGQLAVAQTILNRTASGRFPDSVCGVVRQPGQFSFVRHGDLPDTPHGSSAWHRAVAIAMIAEQHLWKQVAPDALFFHAHRVSPGWGKVAVADIGHHIFFR